MNILEDLKKRKIFSDITNEKKFNELKPDDGVYIGFDPTASSLHLGNYVQIMTLLRFKKQGFKTVAVLGGATAMIGDPSGKDKERTLLSEKELQTNKQHVEKQLLSFGLEVVDNFDFYKNISFLDFIRQYGKLININYMLSKDVVASRLESGISFTEFSYQLIQGYDFLELYKKHNVKVQIGGSDQWGNITTGIEMIRKTVGDHNQALGITTNLLLTNDGKKFGKSEGNAIWLDINKTSPFSMYQYLLNVNDKDVAKIMKWLTMFEVDKINDIITKHEESPKDRFAQKALAFEVVDNIHGDKYASEAQKITDALFGSSPISNLTDEEKLSLKQSLPHAQTDTRSIQEALVEVGAATSKRIARELIENNSIEIDGEKINDIDYHLNDKQAHLIKRGKHKFFLLIKK